MGKSPPSYHYAGTSTTSNNFESETPIAASAAD
jgi:hypothetical protein